jgi:type II secretory pathway component PulF
MPTYSVTYSTSSGQTRQLRLQSADLTTARRTLRQRGIVPSSLEEVSGAAAATSASCSKAAPGCVSGPCLPTRWRPSSMPVYRSCAASA